MTNDTIERILAMSDEQVQECARRLMIGGGTRGGPILLRGKGTRVWDSRGKSYIDCTAQSWALYLGYCNEEIWEAINRQAQHLTHVHQGFDTLPRFYLAKLLTDIAPASIKRVSFCPSSALALEGGMKIALKNRPGAAQFVTLWDGYHGTTLGTMGGSWIATKSSGKYAGGSRFLPLLHPTVRAPNPYCYRCYFGQQPANCDLMCAKMLELTLDKGVSGPPAGVIVEPLQASAGMIPCPKRYLERVREICDQREVPLIFDEIQTYLRIGTYFAAQYYGVTPDIIALGKAIGGGLPLGATLIRDGLARLRARRRGTAHLCRQHLVDRRGNQTHRDRPARQAAGPRKPDGQLLSQSFGRLAKGLPRDRRHPPGGLAHRHRAGRGSANQAAAGC